jgi:hypothetical protein
MAPKISEQMKTKIQLLSSLFCLVFLVFAAHGQGVYEWGPALPITDSMTFNSNPTGWLNGDNQMGVFYEKRTCDTCNADVWYRNLSSMEPEIPILTDDNMHDSPIFIVGNSNEFEGFVLFFSSPDGDTNIFAAKLEHDLSISETTQLTFTEAAPSHMVFSYHYGNDHLGWIEDSCAYTAIPQIDNGQISLGEVTKLDSLHNTDIEIGGNMAYFQRKVGDSLHIYARDYEYDHGSGTWYWDETYPIKTTGNNTDMSIDKSEFSMGNELIWLSNNQIHGNSYSYEFVLNTYNLPNIQHPGYIMWDIVVKDEWMPHVLVYATGEGDNTEIYGSFSEYGTNPDTTNLTHDGVRDSHPELFWGESFGNGFWIYSLWQSHRNGHVVLYYSKFQGYIEGGVNEHSDTGITLSVHPNPFVSEVQINLSSLSGEDILVSVYSLSGKQVWQHTIPADNQPTQSCVWVPDPNVPKGIYVVVVNQNGDQTSQRVVYK